MNAALISQLLRTSKSLLVDKSRWGQGVDHRGFGDIRYVRTMGVVTAIQIACTEKSGRLMPEWVSCYNAMMDATGWFDLVAWNDSPDRKHAQVLAAFDSAVSLLEGKQ
jgi:hypothetical protein